MDKYLESKQLEVVSKLKKLSEELESYSEVNIEMLEKIIPYLKKYFSEEEVQYVLKNETGGKVYEDFDIHSLFMGFLPHLGKSEKNKEFYGTSTSIATNLSFGYSPYIGGEKKEYKGNIATDVIKRIIQVVNLKQEKISKRTGIFASLNNVSPSSLGDFRLRLMTKEEYSKGLPLFLGEIAKTCQVVGKSGGAYGVDYLLNPNIENLVFTKDLVIYNSIIEVIVGSPSLTISKDGNKLVISAIELVNVPGEVASFLLRDMAQKLYEALKEHGVEEVQVGIGARTLHDLGYDRFIDGDEGCPEYNKVRAQTANIKDIEKISKIASGEIQAESQGKSKTKSTKQSKLLGSPLTPDLSDLQLGNSVLSKNRDIKYRLTLCDKNTYEALREQLEKESLTINKNYQPAFSRLKSVLSHNPYNIKGNTTEEMRKYYFR